MDLKTKRWLVLIASVLINLCIGSGYAWSVFAKPMVAHLSSVTGVAVTAAAATLAFTISNLFGPVTMIIGGSVQDKFGPRWVIFAGAFIFGGGVFLTGFTTSTTWLYLSYGTLMGLGMGLIYSCTIANTVKFFPDKRGLVAGLATAGYGTGSIVVPPLANSMISSMGIMATFRTLGIAYFIIIAVGSFFVMTAPPGYKPEGWTPPAPSAGSAVSGVDKTWKQMLADPIFYVLLLMIMIGAFSGLMIISQASAIAQETTKVTAAVAAVAVSMIALANTGGRLFWGWVSDVIGRYNALTIMYIISAVSVFALTATPSYSLFVVEAMLIALCFGGIMGIFPALTADMFGPKNNGVNYGIMFSGFAIAAYLGPMTAASVRASSGGYVTAFIVAAVISIVGILLTQVVRSKSKKMQEAAAKA
ncbi:putative MFS-type transporter YhjX [Pelotomaculum sp. FP]|uniref:L-lactate MFS transporter n=1 Tax=Pelotomaculum sp. FP TaxID=261474 RepID=UPI001066D3A9|nr:OFA family MFS transporter [Pelotomaculum sp. FP]TEB11118.1 putative MFS-type transporter YhjX [Pelotomaculum sp. FP]